MRRNGQPLRAFTASAVVHYEYRATARYSLESPLALWERRHDASIATCAPELARGVSSLTPRPLSQRERGAFVLRADAGRFLERDRG